MFVRALLLLCLLSACRKSPAERREASIRAAGERLERGEANTRAAYQRLPLCPSPNLSAVKGIARSPSIPIPTSFTRDTTVHYAHGGWRFLRGDTSIAVIRGYWGWASFTGHFDGGGVLPSGCIARIGGRIYMVTERSDTSGYHAAAMQVEDTVRVSGNVLYSVSARSSMRAWLLALLSLRTAAG
jgi:hypothetical protein